jgi:cytochrome c5
MLGAVVGGCVEFTSQPESTQPPAAPADAKPAAATAPATQLSGNQLWSQYCGLCHNTRSPKDYSDAQWGAAMAHMRIQARLTGEEERKIRAFLQASN